MFRTEVFKGLEKGNPGYEIRQTVFVEEQGFDPNLEFDQKDQSAFHVLVLKNDIPVAIGRFFTMDDGITCYLGRIAVRKAYRGQQIGAYILGQLEQECRKRGAAFAMLGAQLHARGFYEKMGYTAFGDVFDDCGKAHIHMKKAL